MPRVIEQSSLIGYIAIMAIWDVQYPPVLNWMMIMCHSQVGVRGVGRIAMYPFVLPYDEWYDDPSRRRGYVYQCCGGYCWVYDFPSL